MAPERRLQHAWSPDQVRLLQVMGLQPMRLRGRDASCAPDFDHPLCGPVLQASALQPPYADDFDWDGWAARVGLPPLQELARRPQAKRELWRRLRRERAERRG